MSKKRVLWCLFFAVSVLLSLSIISAADNATGFDKSYNCLKTQIDAKGVSTMTPEELAFSLLALSSDKTRQDALKDELEKRKSSTDACWPAGGCTLKDTALVMLAYNNINKDTDSIKNWLMNQSGAPTDLVWYLEIDTNNRSQCTITYDNSSRKITLNEDKTLSGSAGTCFSLAYNNYWLEVNSRCYGKEFTISCDADFLTSTLYKKRTGSTYYVTTSTKTGGPNVEVDVKIESICFKQSGSCNYEGSLWSALAVIKKDSTVRTKILPYLLVFAQDSSTKRYLPSSFLYVLTGLDEYLTDLLTQQTTKGYWQTSDPSRRYYDTAAALMSLYGRDSESVDKAIEYLLDPSIQGDGCWNNNLRDTAFILYSANPNPPATGTGLSPSSGCEEYSHHCMLSPTCDDINGTALPNFYCSGVNMICCDKLAPAEDTCSEKGGAICSYDEECSNGQFTEASGTNLCCIDGGTCTLKQETSDANECTDAGYTCEYQCSAEQESQTLNCLDTTMACCSTIVPAKKSYWWLWLLIILVILVALAIFYRNQIPMWWFKIKSKFTKKPVAPQGRPPGPGNPPFTMQPRPGMMPPPGMRRFVPGMPAPRGMPLRPAPRPAPRPYGKEQELSETLKKLREMGK
jgi:hypothetical protein